MPTPPLDLNPAQAQLLMSQLRDGELAPQYAAALGRYLARHPEALDWMESLELASPHPSRQSGGSEVEAIAAIQREVKGGPARATAPARLLPFPSLFRSVATAAAALTVGSLIWLSVEQSGSAYARAESPVVEFVATDMPNASTFVYTDDESGWTVVWVEPMEPLPADQS